MTRKKLLIIAVVAYLGTAGVAFAGFSVLFQSVGVDGQSNRFARLISPLVPSAGEGKVNVEAGAPKTEECPLNGKLYTLAERQAWEERTPLAIMVENHPDARPQSGLSNADVIFEAVAEGGITRYMAMYYCDAQSRDVIVAPVRSARTYYIDWASSYQEPLYTHVGGANLPGPSNALGQLNDYGWANKNNLNQFSIGFPTFVRNYNRVQLDGRELATEHTMETSTERLWDYARDKRKITSWIGRPKFQPWTFKDDAEQIGTVSTISYDFWEGYRQFSAEWVLDSSTNTYAHKVGGNADIDNNTNEPVKAKNIVILFTTERGPINEAKHMLYGTIGTGKALIFQDGQVVQATWEKASRTAPLNFLVNGRPAPLNRGLTWISVVANGTPIEY